MTALVIIAVLILLNGLFVAAEFAIIGAPKASIDARAARGNRLARAVQAILRDARRQDRYIATAQLGITLASLGLGMYGEHVLAEWIYSALGQSGAPAWLISHGLASTLSIAILTYFHIVVGEMVPKSLALQYAEPVALAITPVMTWIKYLMYPLVVGLNGIGNVGLRLIGIRRQGRGSDAFYTPEELQIIVQESEELGALRGESGQMLRELFEFGELTAGEVMVPRVRLTGIEVGASPEEVRGIMQAVPHTRYPIFQGDLDHILGVVHVKDLLRVLLGSQVIDASHARPVPMVPETAALDGVLAAMRSARTQMAIVIDEHGGTAGVVTLEDLFEEVVGEIGEDPLEPPPVYKDPQGRLRVDGTMRVEELGQQFDLDLEHEDVDSVSGLILTLLGRPAQVGDRVVYERLEFEVTAVKGHGVDECAVTLLEAPPE
jgi:CBS domain containing-hemolysin-like protein